MVGVLEFRDNAFVQSIIERLRDVRVERIRAAQVAHPAPSPYRVILDRVSFCDPFLRHLMRYWSLSGAYVLNNPFFTLVMDKFSDSLVYDELSIRHPRTILLPGKNGTDDVSEIVAEPDWAAIEAQIGFPCILKPVDGYAWQDVFKVQDPPSLRSLYESLKRRCTLIVQQLITFVGYYRAFGIDRDVFIARWSPQPFDQGAYSMPEARELGALEEVIRSKTVQLNRALGLDFNAVEWCVTPEGAPVVIDSYNDVPDVRREKLPGACYDWVVENVCALLRAKLASGETNRIMPGVRPGSDAGAFPG